MGLPDQHFDFVVLLCQIDPARTLDFVFPATFVSEIWHSLSRQYQGNECQVKFDVRRRPNGYELTMPKGHPSKQIRPFLGQTELLM